MWDPLLQGFPCYTPPRPHTPKNQCNRHPLLPGFYSKPQQKPGLLGPSLSWFPLQPPYWSVTKWRDLPLAATLQYQGHVLLVRVKSAVCVQWVMRWLLLWWLGDLKFSDDIQLQACLFTGHTGPDWNTSTGYAVGFRPWLYDKTVNSIPWARSYQTRKSPNFSWFAYFCLCARHDCMLQSSSTIPPYYYSSTHGKLLVPFFSFSTKGCLKGQCHEMIYFLKV